MADVTFDHGAPGRLVEFVPAGATFRPGREWTYMMSPTPRVEGFEEVCSDGENGLVELVALSDTTADGDGARVACSIKADRARPTRAR